MLLKDVNLLEVGNEIQLVGALYSGKDELLFMLPGEVPPDLDSVRPVIMDDADWKKFLDQTDNLNAQVVVGNVKAILRKCQRTIDQNISWTVYRRDSYMCRYCGANDVPFTVDHIDLWEQGGATAVDNLLTCCKKCNRIRGNTVYEDWIVSPKYAERSKALPANIVQENLKVVATLPELRKQRVKTIKLR